MSDKHEPSDADLVVRAREGDEDALRELFERHLVTMQRFAERRLPQRLRRRASVADVLQEARLVALRRCAEFEDQGESSFRNWLLGIVERKVRETIRAHEGASKRSVRREVTRGARPETREHVGRIPSPSAVVMGREAVERAERALARLSPDHRQVLTLTRRHHLSLDEAAERMGRGREATRKLLARAVAAFAAEYEGADG